MMHGSEATYAQLLVDAMPHTIRDELDADRVQARIDELIDKPGELTAGESELLSLLGDLILVWERGRYEVPDIFGREAVLALLEMHGLRQEALVGPVFSTRSLASELLSGKRRLTYEYVERLSRFFRVSPEVFFPR